MAFSLVLLNSDVSKNKKAISIISKHWIFLMYFKHDSLFVTLVGGHECDFRCDLSSLIEHAIHIVDFNWLVQGSGF